MDYTQALPDDALSDILSRLPPRDLAASRCVRKVWLAVIDAHRLLLPHVLPHSVGGLFINYVDYYGPMGLFARPTVLPAIDLSFLPLYQAGIHTAVDHCNGLLLCWEVFRTTICVVNPATRRWEDVAWKDKDANPYLVFDPAASPHYEVFSVPRVPEEVVFNSSAPQGLNKSSDFSTNLESPSNESRGEKDDPHDMMEWPSSSWTLNVFSSSTREWQVRSFVREGDVAGTMTNVQLDPLKPIDTCWRHSRGPRWPYSAYWQGSLYIQCNDSFVVRLSLSDCKYQLIKSPIDTEKTKHAQFLGISGKELYLATVHGTCLLRVWYLTEASGKIDWVLKHDIDLEPLSVVWLHDLQGFDKTWAIVDDDVHCYYDYYDDDDEEENKKEDVDVEVEVEDEEQEEEEYDKEEGVQKENNETIPSKDHEWNSDDDNVLNIKDYGTCCGKIYFLGFHPYKEVVFLGLASLVGVAYHLKSSKVQYMGKMRLKDYNKLPTNGIYEAFPYTPCMIGKLLKHTSEGPRGH